MTAINLDLLGELVDDGDTVEIDGRKLRLRIESDPYTRINDFDCYGKLEWSHRDSYTEHASRPAGFTGNAEILDRAGQLWWEPPKDVKRSDPEFAKLRSAVLELYEYGFHGIILEELDGEDAYGQPIVRKTASLWGIDDIGPEYVREVVADLIHELA